jgi:hypothetical protein
MFKGLVILSVLLNVVLAGGLGAYWFFMPQDAEFFVAYNKKTPESRAIIRDADKIFSQTPGLTRVEYEQLLINDDMRKKYSEFTSAEAVQDLLVESTRATVANQNSMLEHQHASVERFAMRRGEYRDFERDLTAGKETLRAEREAFERDKKDWEDLQLNTYLNQIVEDINKTEDGYEEVAQRVTGIPTIQQAYVLRSLKNGLARTEIEAALPADERAALKNFNARANAMAGTMVGGPATAGR